MEIPVAVVTDLDVRSIEYYQDDPDEERKKKMLHCSDEVKKAIGEKCPSVDFTELPDYLTTKTELYDYLTSHKKEGVRGKSVKSQEREDAKKYFEENATEITNEAIAYLRQKKIESLSSLYTDGEIKLFVAKNWTLEYEIAKSGLYKELAMAVCMAKGEQSDNPVTMETAQKTVDDNYKSGTNDMVAYQIFKPINDGSVSKAIVAQYLAEIIESKSEECKSVFESDENLAYLVEAIKHATTEKL